MAGRRGILLFVLASIVAGLLGALPAVAADDDRVVYECSGDICAINADGTGEVNLTNSPGWEEIDPVWSPDGTKIAFSGNVPATGNPDANYEIFTMNADGTNIVQQTFTVEGLGEFVQSFAPSWSPTGTEIAFEGWRISWAQIIKVPADGSGTEVILTSTTDFASKFQPDWSPDGTKILFTWSGGAQDIFVMNQDGSNPVNLTADLPGSDQRDPSWSPDGARFAFTDTRFWNIPDFNTEIFVRNADGSGEIQVTDHPSIDDTPSWSPDGATIIFSSARGGFFEIWTIAAPSAGAASQTQVEALTDSATRIDTSGPAADPDADAAGGTPVTFALNVTKAGTGSGTVTSNPAGIRCGADCSETYAANTVVTLNAKAPSGTTFAGWSGACSGTGPCVVTMNAAKTVTASFNTGGGAAFTLTVTKAGTGTGMVTSSPAGIKCGTDCSQSYTGGTTVTLTPRAGRGFTFIDWSGACTGTGACVVTMNAAKTVTATFGEAESAVLNTP